MTMEESSFFLPMEEIVAENFPSQRKALNPVEEAPQSWSRVKINDPTTRNTAEKLQNPSRRKELRSSKRKDKLLTKEQQTNHSNGI